MMDVLWKENNVLYNILCFIITENEKIFDRNEARLYCQTVFHIFSITHHVYIGLFSLSLDLNSYKEVEIITLHRFRTCYLTGWNFVFQTLFLSLALIHDVLEWADKHETKWGGIIRYWRDVVFSGLVFPVTMFVSAMFWSVYWVDRELVFPKVFDNIVPTWFNHCVHTNILVVVIVETILQARRQPTDFKVETFFYVVISLAYAIVYYSIYFFAGRWLYMVFGTMTWWQVCLYQLLIWSSTHLFYRIQYPINRFIHGPALEDQTCEKVSPADTQASKEMKANGEVISNGKAVSNGKAAPNGNGVLNGNGVPHANGIANNGFTNDDVLKDTPFADKSWSLKYRTIRNQFENSSL